MTKDNALEKLDEAVRAFSDEFDDAGIVSGWVLLYQRTALRDGPIPRVTGTSYAMAPSTTPEEGLGMLVLTQRRIERAVLSYDYSAGDEEGE